MCVVNVSVLWPTTEQRVAEVEDCRAGGDNVVPC